MKFKRKQFWMTGATLIVFGLFGILFASPEPVRFVERPDGTVTAVPRNPWAAACAELVLALGVGCLIVSPFVKKEVEQELNHVFSVRDVKLGTKK